MIRSSDLRIRIKPDRTAAIAVSCAALIYFLPALIAGRVLCPWDGLLQNVPFRVVAAEMVRNGNLPLWNPYIFSGMPLLATAQVGVLYPLNWFYVGFSTTTATNLMVISTYMVAGLGAYLYARKTGASVAGAAITSLAWQFGGAMIGQLSHINMAQTAALLPWLLWSIDRHAEKATIKRGGLVSLILALQFFAGHQQAFVNSLLLATAYVIVMAVTNRELRTRYLTSFAFVGVGVLLAAIQILPTYELLQRSERSAATYEFFSSFSMPKRFILAFVAPYVMGGGDGRLFRAPYAGPPYYPEMVGYVGLLTIILVVIAVAAKPDVRAKFWAAVAVLCLLLAFGAYAPFQFYKLIYYLPLLNLFRVPARHVMEVDFALAVLAGRGFTVLATHRGAMRTRLIALTSACVVLLFTILAVTLLRPADFHLARALPITILRAPELFIPIIVAFISAYGVWLFVGRRRGATVLLLSLLFIDLALWGQSSGWYVASPHAADDYFRRPPVVDALNKFAPADKSSFRILTAGHEFDPAAPPVPPSVSHSDSFVLWTQPDIYMMHGIPNAAGYDGFGLDRYSQLAGRMKVWGELTDPDRTLRSQSREIDLANVRYLLSMRKQSNTDARTDAFAKAPQKISDYLFAENDLGLPSLVKEKRLTFSVPPVEVDRIALITHLAWSENIPDQTVVAHLRLNLADGHSLDYPLHAGTDTAEWSYDQPEIKSRIRHRRAVLATSYKVDSAQGSYDAHTYLAAVILPQVTKVTGGEIVLDSDRRWPDLSLSVFRISLNNSVIDRTYALKREMVDIDQNAAEQNAPSNRWELLGQTDDVDIYENHRPLPRAWLASQATVLNEAAMLEVIRTGRFSDGKTWDPTTTVLAESPLAAASQAGSPGETRITKYEPARIDLVTRSDAPSILVLSENHYPGWRAYVDGRFVDTLRVDYNLRGAILPAGEHTVEFVYRPKSFLLGAALSLFALALLAAGVIIERRYRAKTH